MLIPEQWEQKVAFMTESMKPMKALGATANLFGFFGGEPKQSDELNFGGFVNTMQALCRSHRRVSSGIEDRRFAISVFDAYYEAVRQHRALGTGKFRRGVASAQRYRWWLT